MPQRVLTSPRDTLIWHILQIIGVIFLLIGVLDIASSWLPSRLGDPEWELGTTSNFFDVVPLLGLGLAFLLAAAVSTGRRWTIRLIATLCLLTAVFMLLAMVLYATVLPLAFKIITNPLALTQIKKAATKTGVQALLYPFAMLWLAGAGWKSSFGRRRP